MMTRRVISCAVAGVVLVGAVSGCGGSDKDDPGSIKNTPDSSSSVPEPTGPAQSSGSGGSASSASPEKSSDAVFDNTEDIGNALKPFVNGALGPSAANSLKAGMGERRISVDDSVDRVFSQAGGSRLVVSDTVDGPKIDVQGRERASFDFTVVKGHSLYKPGESEDDGGKRAHENLKMYYNEHQDMQKKHIVFVVNSSDGGKTGTLSVEEK